MMGIILWASIAVIAAFAWYFELLLYFVVGFIGFIFGVWIACDQLDDPYERPGPDDL
jgi:uncharacterized membrane protein YiaA